jgi:hypothetical protein
MSTVCQVKRSAAMDDDAQPSQFQLLAGSGFRRIPGRATPIAS